MPFFCLLLVVNQCNIRLIILLEIKSQPQKTSYVVRQKITAHEFNQSILVREEKQKKTQSRVVVKLYIFTMVIYVFDVLPNFLLSARL